MKRCWPLPPARSDAEPKRPRPCVCIQRPRSVAVARAVPDGGDSKRICSKQFTHCFKVPVERRKRRRQFLSQTFTVRLGHGRGLRPVALVGQICTLATNPRKPTIQSQGRKPCRISERRLTLQSS